MNSVFTIKTMEDFFKLLGCRTTINEETEDASLGNINRVVVKVPKKNYHFVRCVMAERMAMGILYDVQLLKFWENRVNKYQFNWRK